MDIPLLRQDLRLLPGGKNEAGENEWLLYDPLRHQYFALSRTALLLLRYLPKISSLEDLKNSLSKDDATVDDHEIEQFLVFLRDNFLSVGSSTEHVEKITAAQKARQHHWFMWLVHNYLFIKIPLIRPDRFLDGLLRIFRPLVGKTARTVIYGLGAYGVLSLFWQWDAFLTTFDYFFNLQGLIYFGLAMIAVKIAHELGHALVAKHHGLRVSSMGVALLVLFPVLYTDNTDAWRLTDQRKKLQIVLAGLMVEFHIALLALFSWTVVEDGPLRSAAFFLATGSLVGSLLVNLSPFMRFDGYYALADFLGMQNLQPRAFELARWQVRQWLFGLPENAPEPFPATKHYFLVFYSFATWIYRFFLFLGIALLVYFFAFKLLGIFLFAVEIIWFIGRPIYAETKRWVARRALFSMNKQMRRTLGIMLVFLLLAFAPWRMSITAPAIIESTLQTPIHLPEPAQVTAIYVTKDQEVRKGDPLLTATSPALNHQIELAEREMRLLELEVRRYAVSPENLRDKLVSEQQLAEAQSRLSGLLKRRDELQLVAPSSGIVQFSRHIAPGHWLEPEQQLLFVFEPRLSHVVSFVEEARMHRVQNGAEARFVADDGIYDSVKVRLITIDETAIEDLAYPELSSINGGPIAVHTEQDGAKTVDAYYKLHAELLTIPNDITANVVGTLHIETAPYAPMANLWRATGALLLRESGF
jgi:putative peptide zinc metalloprotease protein